MPANQTRNTGPLDKATFHKQQRCREMFLIDLFSKRRRGEKKKVADRCSFVTSCEGQASLSEKEKQIATETSNVPLPLGSEGAINVV